MANKTKLVLPNSFSILFRVVIESTSLGALISYRIFGFYRTHHVDGISRYQKHDHDYSEGCLVTSCEYFSRGLIILPHPLCMQFFLPGKFFKLPVGIPVFIVLFQKDE